jgi:hypothetical protein
MQGLPTIAGFVVHQPPDVSIETVCFDGSRRVESHAMADANVCRRLGKIQRRHIHRTPDRQFR